MRIATILLLLSFVGCSAINPQERAQNAEREAHQDAIQRVLSAAYDVRTANAPDTYNASVFRSLATGMENVDLAGCPTDFVIAFKEYCSATESMATYCEYAERRAEEYSSGAKMFESFVRGMFRDGGTIAETSQLKDELQKGMLERSETMQKALRKIQAVSAEYGIVRDITSAHD